MNFYKHHIGDYDADTAHLSMLEDAAYSRLMRAYYRMEQPIPAEIKQACRLVRAISKAERDAVATVLNEFFYLKEDGWHNKRCDEELTAYRAQADTNRRIAQQRSVKRNNNEPSNESLHGSSPDRAPSQKPEATSQNPESRTTALSTVVGKESAIEIATALRAQGVNCSAMHPSIQELANDGVSIETALEALRIAKQDRGKDKPSIGYLMPIIKDMRTTGGNWPHAKPSATMAAIMTLEGMKS